MKFGAIDDYPSCQAFWPSFSFLSLWIQGIFICVKFICQCMKTEILIVITSVDYY